jgi:hypothetical protein
MIKHILLLLCLFLPLSVVPQTWQTQSSEQQVAVLELFTSEGCGLCPEADRWVHGLPKQGYGKESVIVLGFHIDYLNDKKGWVDRFARPEFAERQRQLARLNLYKTIYTPEFVVSGEVIHNWKKYAKAVVDVVNSYSPQSDISLMVEHVDDQLTISADVNVQGEQNRQHATLFLAITEDDLISKIDGGDNIGATFNHQNVVRQWLGPFDLEHDGETQLSIDIPVNSQWNFNKLSVVGLVQNLDDGFVLQSVDLPLVTEEF